MITGLQPAALAAWLQAQKGPRTGIEPAMKGSQPSVLPLHYLGHKINLGQNLNLTIPLSIPWGQLLQPSTPEDASSPE